MTLPVRARLAASRATSIAISASKPAHRQPKAFARQEAFLVQVGAEPRQPFALAGVASGITGSAASAFSRPAPRPSARRAPPRHPR